MSDFYIILAIFMGFLATFGGRILPFLLFASKSEGKHLTHIQRNMPLVIMVVLVFYTLFSLDFSSFSKIIIAVIAYISTFIVQIIFKNAILSIFVGTFLYMILWHFV